MIIRYEATEKAGRCLTEPLATEKILKDESLHAKKCLGAEGRPKKPSRERKCSRHLLAMGSRECKELPAYRSLLRC